MAKTLLLALFMFSTLFQAQAQSIDPKAQVMLTTAGYGCTAGGLLGIASLAFGGNGRAMAQGASLGLYAGIIFGFYVVFGGSQYQSGEGGTDMREEIYDSRPVDIDQLRFWRGREQRHPLLQWKLTF